MTTLLPPEDYYRFRYGQTKIPIPPNLKVDPNDKNRFIKRLHWCYCGTKFTKTHQSQIYCDDCMIKQCKPRQPRKNGRNQI